MPAFKKAYKKLALSHQLMINDVIKEITNTPKVGQEKRGNLSGVFVYKFN